MTTRSTLLHTALAALGLLAAGMATAQTASSHNAAAIARGQYLVRIGGCNDCHTPGYAEQSANTPVAQWLTGVPLGFQGPWGTSYAANLRLTVQGMNEAEWLKFARVPRLPPMPWFSLRDMNDADLGAMYQFIKSLGAQGGKMPAAVAPGGKVTTPFIVFAPQMPAATGSSKASSR
jgi:mono/diheme cytochrome c family protein